MSTEWTMTQWSTGETYRIRLGNGGRTATAVRTTEPRPPLRNRAQRRADARAARRAS